MSGSTKKQTQSGSAWRDVVKTIAAEMDWILILGLIFGGCCSNAYFLELCTRAQPSSGTLLTVAQFVFVAIVNLPSQLEWRHPASESTPRASENGTTAEGEGGTETKLARLHMQRYAGQKGAEAASLPTSLFAFLPRVRRPAVPLTRWSVQVLLYAATSLLNNVAFVFGVPMPVHIIFRSAGLVVNMGLGWAVGKRYTILQVGSVFLVTMGVILATLATAPSADSVSSASSDASSTPFSNLPIPPYVMGVLFLTLALLLSGLMGLYQERTYARYGSENWQEGLFYSHFLALPLFLIWRGRLENEWAEALQSKRIWIGLGARPLHLRASDALDSHNLLDTFGLRRLARSAGFLGPRISATTGSKGVVGAFFGHKTPWLDGIGLSIPILLPLLALNILTQLLCINGVNRLTARVSSLTVTLVLVVRKAASLAISVVLVGGSKGNPTLWIGASAVLVGTLGYSIGGSAEATASEQATGEKRSRISSKKNSTKKSSGPAQSAKYPESLGLGHGEAGPPVDIPARRSSVTTTAVDMPQRTSSLRVRNVNPASGEQGI